MTYSENLPDEPSLAHPDCRRLLSPILRSPAVTRARLRRLLIPKHRDADAGSIAAARATLIRTAKAVHGEKGQGGPSKAGRRHKAEGAEPVRKGTRCIIPIQISLSKSWKGGDGMPAFADKLKPDEINDCVRFIRHEFRRRATAGLE